MKNRNKVLLEAVGITPLTVFTDKENIQKINLFDDDEKTDYFEYGYSNNILKKELKNILTSYKFIKHIGNLFSKLVDKNIVIPIFTQKSTFKLIVMDNTPYFREDKSTMGFFDPKFNKIFLILNNVGNSIGNISDTNIFELISHEIIHYFFANFSKEALDLFLKPLIYFYYVLLYYDNKENKYDIDLKNKENDLKKLVIELLKTELFFLKDEENMSLEDQVKKVYDIYKKILGKNTKVRQFFENLLEDDVDIYSSAIQLNHGDNRQGKRIFLTAYNKTIEKFFISKTIFKNIFEIPISSLFYQELFYPSEVISLISGYTFEMLFRNQLKIPPDHPAVLASKYISEK